MTASYDIGINMNSSASADVDKASAILKNLGVETVRVWQSVTDFTNPQMTGSLQRAIDYGNKGFNVTLVVQTKDGVMTDPDAVKTWFTWAMNNPALKAAVDQWEIGNEPDSAKYWKGSLAQYVSQFLKPSYEVLSASGEDVISGAPSWNPQDVQTLINAGMLNYTDYVGFHPYGTGVSGIKKLTQQVNDVVNGRKPIAATEWNVRGFENNLTAWAAAVEDAYPIIQSGFDLNYYFAMKIQDSLAGPGGILTSSLAYNQPFYNAFASFAGNDDDDGGGGNTPSTTGTISGVLFNDITPANGVYDGADTITGSRVVYIDANANGKLDGGEKSTISSANGAYTFTGLSAGSYNVTRVFPPGFKLSNNDKGYVTVAVGNGQSVGGANLGSVTTTKTPTPPVDDTQATVTGFVIVNALTDQIVSSLGVITGNTTINSILLPKPGINIKVVTTDATGSVKITALGKTITENNKPFSIFGDDNGNYRVWVPTKGGSYTVSATAYEGVNATGDKGNTMTATITFA